MSYKIETDNKIDHQCLVNVKRRRSTCSTVKYISRAQQKSLCAKHVQSCNPTMNNNQLIKSEICHENLQHTKRSYIRKQSYIKRESISSEPELSVACLNMENIQTKLKNEIYSPDVQLTDEINDDTKSESSIEYDYIYPLSIPTTNSLQYRHVSIATIYLQDTQWHQLELFIKHFSSYASLSNNMNINSSTTHLLIDDSSTPLQCIFSKKIFQAVARHIFIVSIRWIEECLLRNEIVNENPYEIHGDSTMSTMHLARHSSTKSLFPSSVSFVIDCISFQRILTRNELAELVILSGATLFNPEEKLLTKILLVLVDPRANRIELENKYKQWHKNIKYLTPGFLLKSIIYQKQQPFEDFEL
ncbi:unnamed protein product [Adineta steineri]|uniref:BRCT domain-containing protein n=1 Tax=Adineta steineri TaxID=433720 RepID=A0A818FSM3_9BILA|nr:unnamed protein product [Adineta steineri]